MPEETPERYVALGLDLGQTQDYAALAGGEMALDGEGHARIVIRGAKRFPLGTHYPEIVRQVSEQLKRPELAGAALVIDALAVGAAVVDMFVEAGLSPVCVKVHGGSEQSCVEEEGRQVWRIPKRNLVSAIVAPLQQGRLTIEARIPDAETVKRELLAYRLKVSAAGHDSYEAWRESDHDDLVFAIGLVVWYLARFGGRREVSAGGRPHSAGFGSEVTTQRLGGGW